MRTSATQSPSSPKTKLLASLSGSSLFVLPLVLPLVVFFFFFFISISTLALNLVDFDLPLPLLLLTCLLPLPYLRCFHRLFLGHGPLLCTGLLFFGPLLTVDC